MDIDNLLLDIKIKIFSEIRQQAFGILSHFLQLLMISDFYISNMYVKRMLNILEYFVNDLLAKLKHKNNSLLPFPFWKCFLLN